ncbi:metallophosphoesterase, partial [Persephonella sp.]
MDSFLAIKTDTPYAVIGDIHGCVKEFEKLVNTIRKEYGSECLIISAGDTIDRGDYNIRTLELCMTLYEEGNFLEVQSNHNHKLVRWLKGGKVKISYGMQKTVDEFNKLSESERLELTERYLNYYSK